ncbi:MAG TPA: UDP-glucose/GDP-mannose dehydrogenase family protein [Candidatus Desulfaltia sp.]|nr:UDP-glucose/GDP-mannose dehydrogenase family protein [Candidatus Desulfaltia sp.]
MKIAVIGTGYVGLVTAAGLAELGNQVIGTDKDEAKIDRISRGVIPIYEPGLDELLSENIRKGRLSFSADLNAVIREAEVIFVCVGTPQHSDGSADMSQIEEVSRLIADNLNRYKLVVEKSTVPVKTSFWIKRTIGLYKKTDTDFDIASNPEFLREGSAVSDFLLPDRIIVGVEAERARDLLCGIYEKLRDRVVVTNIDTAELIKHASNSFLALKISYINLISSICDKTDANVEQVAQGMGLDPRIGSRFLKAGIGYGGSCFPKDIKALVKIGEDLGVDMSLLKEADRVNFDRIRIFVEKIKQALWILKDKRIALLGLAFKPETDDIREAPSINVVRELLREEARLRLYDPQAMENMKEVYPSEPDRLEYCDSAYQAAEGTNALIILTEWEEFAGLDLERIKEAMANPIILDGRNVFDPAALRKLGFEYYSIGRK